RTSLPETIIPVLAVVNPRSSPPICLPPSSCMFFFSFYLCRIHLLKRSTPTCDRGKQQSHAHQLFARGISNEQSLKKSMCSSRLAFCRSCRYNSLGIIIRIVLNLCSQK